MIHASVLPAKADYKLLKFTQNDESKGVLRPIRRDDAKIPATMVKSVKPQQLIAGMAFRLLGLDATRVYKADRAFMRAAVYGSTQLAETGLNGYPNTIVHTAQLLKAFVQNNEVAEHGHIKKNNVSDYLSELTAAGDDDGVVSFSKVKNGKEIVIVYNTSEADAKEKFILLDNSINAGIKRLEIIYGYETCGHMHLFHGMHGNEPLSFIKIYLKPLHLVILKNY